MHFKDKTPVRTEVILSKQWYVLLKILYKRSKPLPLEEEEEKKQRIMSHQTNKLTKFEPRSRSGSSDQIYHYLYIVFFLLE